MKVKALKFTKNHGFHGNKHFSQKKANFTEMSQPWNREFGRSLVIRLPNWSLISAHLFVYRDLQLKQPIYSSTATYGHFGRPEFTWEQPKILHFWHCHEVSLPWQQHCCFNMTNVFCCHNRLVLLNWILRLFFTWVMIIFDMFYSVTW